MASNNAQQVETLKPENSESIKFSTPLVKTEDPTPQSLDTLPSNPSLPQTPDVATLPTPSKAPTQVKTEPVSPPDNAAQTEQTSSSTPAPANGIAAALATALAASLNPSAPAAAASPSPATPCNPAPVADSAPVKRSRSPEPGDQVSNEKRQKTEHIEEPQAMETDDTKAEGEPEPEHEPPGFLGWDLGAQLSSVLGSVEPESGKDANGTAEDSPMDIMPSISLLPPPRKRPEKMKFIENPTYFSRAMGLPMLGSLVGCNSKEFGLMEMS